MQQQDAEPAVTCGTVGSLDTSSTRAETEAVVQLMLAAEAKVPVTVYIDNKTVQQHLAGAMAGRRPNSKWSYGDWFMVRTLSAACPGSSSHWVPSHDKNEGWSPSTAHGTQEVRGLNAAADEVASNLARRLHDRHSADYDMWCTSSDTVVTNAALRLTAGETNIMEDYLPQEGPPQNSAPDH